MVMRSSAVLTLGLSTALLVLAPGACAQPPPPPPPPVAVVPAGPSPEALAEAMRLYDEGVRAADAGQWAKARDQFLGVWRIRPHWRVAANLGRAEMKVNDYRDAAEHLTFFLREAPEVAPEDRRLTQQMLDKAKSKVGALAITVNLPGAAVLVGGQVVGQAPLAGLVFVDPGQVIVEARLAGFTAVPVARIAIAGKEDTVNLQLAKVVAAATREPTVPAEPAGSEHPARANVQVVAERREQSPSKAILISGGIVGLVGLVVGTGFAVGSNIKASTSHDLEQRGVLCSAPTILCGSQFDALQRDKATFAGVSMWSFIGAAAVLAGTGVYALVSLSSKTELNAQVAVDAGKVGATITLPW